MDVGLPGMSGIEATQRLLAIQPQTRVLILTGRSADEAERDALAAGASDYLVKGGVHEQVRDRILEIGELVRSAQDQRL
jgi:DNA-binding NarL/FixJ family response regulator